MSEQDILDLFDELPRRVQAAVLSNVHSMRSRGVIGFWDYPLPVAEYIQASGLMGVRISDNGRVTFTQNDASRILRVHMRRLLESYGFEMPAQNSP